MISREREFDPESEVGESDELEHRSKMTVASSNDIFRGHRALGLVCNSIPFVLKFQQNRKEYLIFTAVGRHFHSYGVSFGAFHCSVDVNYSH